MLTRFILLILLLETTHGFNSTFVFTGKLYCSQKQFKYRIGAWEDDNVYDDDIGHTGTQFGIGPAQDYRIVTSDYGDGNNFYEIYFLINHNCDSRGRTLQYEVFIGEFKVIDGTTQNITNIQLDNDGWGNGKYSTDLI